MSGSAWAPERYSATMMLGDVNNDLKAERIARTSGGLSVSDYAA